MILPPQKLSKAEKEKRHDKTGKNNIEETADYYLDGCNWDSHVEEILSLHLAVEGQLADDDEEYKLVQNPYNKQGSNEGHSKYNATLKNFNILKGIVNLLMGEFGKRSHEYEVISLNPTDSVTYKDGLNILIKNYYSQAVANSLGELGFDLGQNIEELPTLEDYLKEFKDTFDETRVLSGQEVLDYIRYNADLDSKYLDLYYDWIVTGGAYTYKDVNHDDVTLEVVPRHELYIPMERNVRLVEDRSFVVRRQILPIYKIVDRFKEKIDEETLTILETAIDTGLGIGVSNMQAVARGGGIYFPSSFTKGNKLNLNNTHNGVELFHVVYKTFKRYGVLTYINELGIESIMEVGDDYKLNKEQGDISIEWLYQSQLYEVYKCLDLYLYSGELLENREDLNQEGIQKLPYNGIEERSINGEVQSIVKDGLNYQRSINVLKYQVEKLINKNKDKVLVLPYGLVPRKKGIGTKEQMYHMDSTSILWIDETAPNASFAAQLIKSVDLSLGTFIRDSLELIRATKLEYWDSIGMNNQRYSNISQSAGKGVTEQAIIQSSTITYELTRQFEFLMGKDYQGLLDLSKLAYINGKKSKYIRSDGSNGFINMNQDAAIYHSESSYNIFIRDSSIMTEGINAIRGQAVNLVQNGGDTSILGELYSTNSVTKLTKILRKLEENKREYEALIEQQRADNIKEIESMKIDSQEKDRELEYYKIDKEFEGIIESAKIRTGNNSRDLPRPANDVDKKLAEHKIQKDNKDLAIKEKQLQIKKNTNTTKK